MTEPEGARGNATGREAVGETRSVGGEVEVEASLDTVWKALTDARELERWFPLEARVDPGEGGSIFMSWKNEYAGESEILVWDPPFHLRVRWVEGAEVTDYRLEASGGRTLLRVTSSFPSLDSGWDDWVEGTRRGWRFMLASLRQYLERHAGEDRTVLYLRRREALSPEEVWERLTGPKGLPDGLLRGRVIDEDPPYQRTLVTRTPADGLLRVSSEPVMGDAGRVDATVWLSAWGEKGQEAAGLRDVWRRELERILPDGEDV